MKNYFFILFFVFTLSLTATAQYGSGGYGGGYGGNRNGLNRNIGNIPQTPRKPTEPTEKEKEERINKYMDKLKTDLKLDELQMIAIKNEIAANSKNIEKVMKGENSEEDKTKEIEAISEKTERNIMGFLNKEQKEKYKIVIEERKAKMLEYTNHKQRNSFQSVKPLLVTQYNVLQ